MTARCCSARRSCMTPVCTAPPVAAMCTSRTPPAMRGERSSRWGGLRSGCEHASTRASSTTRSRRGGGCQRGRACPALRPRRGAARAGALRHPAVLAETEAVARGAARRLLARPTRHSSGALAADAAGHVQAAGTPGFPVTSNTARVGTLAWHSAQAASSADASASVCSAMQHVCRCGSSQHGHELCWAARTRGLSASIRTACEFRTA
jgi:hypothetical protein